MTDAPALVSYAWQGTAMYEGPSRAIPRVGEFVTLPQVTHPILGTVDTPTHWQVLQVAWEAGAGEGRPAVTLHLRRLDAETWRNRSAAILPGVGGFLR